MKIVLAVTNIITLVLLIISAYNNIELQKKYDAVVIDNASKQMTIYDLMAELSAKGE